jgi:hypothetical protein
MNIDGRGDLFPLSIISYLKNLGGILINGMVNKRQTRLEMCAL